MGSYDSMTQKLLPLRLYDLSAGSVLDSELKAYAAGLDPLFDALGEMVSEAWIPTAESYGLSEREAFIDREKPDLTAAQRRALLLTAEQARGDSATAAGFRQYLHDCGLENVNVSEYPTRQRLTISINDILSAEKKAAVREKIMRAIPAHLTVTVNYQNGSSESF